MVSRDEFRNRIFSVAEEQALLSGECAGVVGRRLPK
jgi:hypothetical protein